MRMVISPELPIYFWPFPFIPGSQLPIWHPCRPRNPLWKCHALGNPFLKYQIPIWACTKRSSNCEGRMLFLTRGPYALLRFPQFCLREIPVFRYAYAVLMRSLWIRICAQTCSGSLRTRLLFDSNASTSGIFFPCVMQPMVQDYISAAATFQSFWKKKRPSFQSTATHIPAKSHYNV